MAIENGVERLLAPPFFLLPNCGEIFIVVHTGRCYRAGKEDSGIGVDRARIDTDGRPNVDHDPLHSGSERRLSALGNETRVAIHREIADAEDALSFSDLRERVGTRDSGKSVGWTGVGTAERRGFWNATPLRSSLGSHIRIR
ncbi:DUF7347 domain-containing protein [Halococcus salifodinae]|uniref:DUF7347 domain-containing protein n=1 Tax=Halococcus salifodinae TaxID=36738 RepID=UPI003F84B68B